MTIRSSLGYRRINASYIDYDWHIYPDQTLSKRPPAIYVHGAGGNALDLAETLISGAETTAIRQISQHFNLLVTDQGGGFTWSNAAFLNAIDAEYDHFINVLGYSAGTKVTLFATSMGVMNSMRYLKMRSTKVLSITGFIPSLNLQDMHDNNRAGLAASIDTAHGGNYVPATHNPDFNPITYGNSLADIPIKLWYSDYDTVCPATEHIATFSSLRTPNPLTGGTPIYNTQFVQVGTSGIEGHSSTTIQAALDQGAVAWAHQFV